MIPTEQEFRASLEARHTKKYQAAFQNASVAICGLGGLGSNIAVSLTRAGIGKLILIDFDRVDVTNIHRQQYKFSQVGLFKTEALKENLKEISPFCEVEIHTLRINRQNAEEILMPASIVCEAFDDAETKAEIVNLVLEKMPQKYLIAASGMAGFGSANLIKTRKITDKFYLCGDEKSDVADGIGLVSTRVAVCANHQAHAVLNILINNSEKINESEKNHESR